MEYPKVHTRATVIEKAGAVLAIIILPVVLCWSLITSPFVLHNKRKPWRRICSDMATRYFFGTLNIAQMLYISGTTLENYKAWAKQSRESVIVEELGEDARLLWAGPIRKDRVILYIHGGAFIFPMLPYAPAFCKYVTGQLKENDLDVGLAILNYSLVPEVEFPTQLKQARLVLLHLITSGVRPQNIQLLGDSAGGNLILQLLSHMLHPLEGVPPIVLSEPLQGVCLISPSTALTADSGSYIENNKIDLAGKQLLQSWGAYVLAGVPEIQKFYMEASKAPEYWFESIETINGRVLITCGTAECFRDDIILFESQLRKHHNHVTLYMQKGAIHDEPYLDFLVGRGSSGMLPSIVTWIAGGFTKHQVTI